MGHMTDEQKFLFDLNGYLVIPDALNSSEIESLKAAAYRLAHEKYPDPEMWDKRGEPTQSMRIHRIIEKDDIFLNMVDHPSTIGIIQELTGGSPKLIDNDTDLKPRTEKMEGWHRGVEPWGYSAADGRFFCLMVKIIYYLTDVSIGECPTRIVPGSHKSRFPAPIPANGEDNFPGAVEFEVKAGSAFIFSEALLHAGNRNDSDKVRVNLYYNYGPSFVEPWEGYRPSEKVRDEATSDIRRQLLGAGRVYNQTEEHGRKNYA